DAVCARDENGRIACASGFFADVQWLSRYPLNALQHFAHAVPVTVPHVEHLRVAAISQVGECVDMGRSQVLDVDVVTDTSTICSRVVGAEDRHMLALPNGGLARHLDK